MRFGARVRFRVRFRVRLKVRFTIRLRIWFRIKLSKILINFDGNHDVRKHTRWVSTVLKGGRENYFCGARKYEIPSEDKYKVDAGQIQSRGAQIRYRDWDKSDIKGFRQLSRGC